MTICIAAACEDGKHVVVCADRMFTVGPPLNVEFEPPLTKIEAMGSTCRAMGSGNGLFVAEILSRARASYQNVPTANIMQIANAVNAAYMEFRDEKIEEQIIRVSLGPDFVSFRNRGGTLPQYLQPQPGIYQQVVVQANQFNLNVDLIVTGIDPTGSYLYYIGHPGGVINFGKIGYNAIGSGATHSAIRFALGLQHPKSSLAETLFSVYSAKNSSEVAPGVGHETEMAVISSDNVWPLPRKMLDQLNGSLKKEELAPKAEVDKIAGLYAELRKDA